MKQLNLLCLVTLFTNCIVAQVHTTYLWHMDQPIYWGEKSQANPNACQYAKESQDIKTAGGNKYSDGISHPLSNLEEIFSKADRVAAYQWEPKTSISMLSDLANAGAQVSFSGDLMQNCNSLGVSNQWGYSPTWYQSYKDARAWKTSGGFPKLDLVAFSKDHCLSPLVSKRTLKKSIQAHRYLVNKFYGSTPAYSKGYWPAECAFSERIIQILAEEDIEWSVVANSHLARTLNDYPITYGTSGCNIDPPNAADKVSINGTHWWNGQIDGRGGTFAAPYCYTPHYAKYVNPETGTEYKIVIVPMCDLLSYRDGYSQQGTGDIDANIAPYNTDPTHPPLVLLAHDGDNAWGGGNSYYEQAVTSFAHAAAAKGYEPTTVQQYLNDHPVAITDVVHVEDGAWVNADSDWGHPLFINWLWPLYNSTTYRFNPDGWTEDARNWAVITAVENYVATAEDLAGGVRIEKCTDPDAAATDAEKAWHFYFTTLNSGYMYYGKSDDMEVKQTVGGNHAIEYAKNIINAKSGIDNTPPTIFNPQRFPYNPGGKGYGPLTKYTLKQMPNDFDIWTYVFDISGLQSVTLKYRTDKDGVNSPSTNDNETYTGGSGVNVWNSVAMTRKVSATGNVTNDPEINFFILPTAIADLYYAPITGLTNVLVDYYVEAVDTKGNISQSDIQHVYVGETANVPVTGVTVSPTTATILVGGTQQLTATISPADATNKNVTWSSSNSGVATVNASGLVTGVALGTATITVTTTDGNKTATCTVTVTNTISGFTTYFYKPSSWEASVKVYWWGALPTGNLTNATWPGVSMDTVINNTSGWYKNHFTNITSTNLIFNDGTNQTADLSRNKNGWYMNGTWYDTNPATVTGVSLNSSAATLNGAGSTYQLTATVAPSYSMNKNVTWLTSNSSVATVNTNGVITAVAAGTTTVTVTTAEGQKTATCTVTVTTGTNYYRIKNRWKTTTYLYDGSNGQLKYGINPAGTDLTYQWQQVSTDGYTMLKNRSTGNFMHIENLYDYVQCGAAQSTWWSAMWTLESTGDGWIRLRNRYKTSDIIHIENLNGYAQHTGAQNTYWSAMWQLESAAEKSAPQALASEMKENHSVNIFPNPVCNNIVNIDLIGFDEDQETTVTISDLSGKVIHKQVILKSCQLSIDIPKGLYIISVNNKITSIKKKLFFE